MRKVKLVVEHLVVESFQTSAAHGRGTVMGWMTQPVKAGEFGHAATYPECPSPLCMDTPLASCDGSCKAGCVAPEPTVGTAVGAG